MTVSLCACHRHLPLAAGGEATMVGPKSHGFAPIAYRCSVASHERAQTRESWTLTYHVDGWAFCASPGSQGHRWIATGGVPLHELLSHRGSQIAR